MIPQSSVRSVGFGCKATGTADGWDLSGERVFQCSKCFDYLFPSRMSDSGGCLCGNLFLDYDHHRFGADTGDDSIQVFDLIEGDGLVVRDQRHMYTLDIREGRHYLEVVCGGIAMYTKVVELDVDQIDSVFGEGKGRLNDYAYRIAKGTF